MPTSVDKTENFNEIRYICELKGTSVLNFQFNNKTGASLNTLTLEMNLAMHNML